MILDTLRAYWLKHTHDLRDTCRDLYRHYRLERERIEQQDRATLRSADDQIILAAIDRARQAQRDQAIEAQVRRFHEASRFVSRKPTDQT